MSWLRFTSSVAILFLGSASALAQRPEPGAGYDVGIELHSVVSPDDKFRVWYVTESADAIASKDVAPADGIPDFAMTIAKTGDAVHSLFVDALGYEPPLVDTDFIAPSQAGGGPHFDVYLKNFGGGDGQFVADGCLAADLCYGHILMQGDFATSSYPSLEIAADVLISHEYFHAIASAYRSGVDAKWSEGTAVWAEEKYNPDQQDFERLIGAYLSRPWRPFDRRSGSAFDGWAYGGGLWVQFLDERFGENVIREIWERLATTSEDHLSTTEAILLQEHQSSLRDAWLEFTRWNLFTGARADSARSYATASHWPEVALEESISVTGDGTAESDQQAEGMSARYIPLVLPNIGEAVRELSITTETGAPAVAFAYFWDGTQLSDATWLEPHPDDPMHASAQLSWRDDVVLFLVLSSASRGAFMRTVHVALRELPPGEEEEPPSPSSGGCSTGTASTHSGSLFMLLVLLWQRRARRNSLKNQP